MPDADWYQMRMRVAADIPAEDEGHFKVDREPSKAKCRRCGQQVLERYLQGSAQNGNVNAGQRLQLHPEPNFYGTYFLAGGLAHRVEQAEKQTNLLYFMEHRCPGFKS